MLRLPARMSGGLYPYHLPPRPVAGVGISLPAPTGGWDASSPLANMKEDRAVVLDNWFPQPGYVEVRRGTKVHAWDMQGGAIETLMPYHGTTSADDRLFAATDGRIYNVTDLGSGVQEQSGRSVNRWQWVNFVTSGGKYLFAVNGTDAPLRYDGSSWAVPTITGIVDNDIININVHKNRIWFVMKDSTKAAYLATGAVSGAATEFELGGLFSKGGYLVAMATWMLDGGSGQDDYAVFISSEGQVAVYQGTDPASADTWALTGVFDLGSPIGYRCFTKVAGDVALINVDGVLPLSKALSTDRAATQNIAITARIQNAMNAAAREYAGNFGWQLTPYPNGTRVILNVPLQESTLQHQYVMNTLTGAWCRFTNNNAPCWVVFNENLYCGTNDGYVLQADVGSTDRGESIDAVGQTAYNYYKNRGRLKRWTLLQPLITTDSSTAIELAMSTDFKDNAVLGTPSSAALEAALYDSALYDADEYALESRNIADWTSISGIGQCAAIHFRALTGTQSGFSMWGEAHWGEDFWFNQTTADVILRLNGFNSVFEPGGFV